MHLASASPPTLFSKARKGSALYAALRRLIVLGHLSPGEALLEIALANEYGCSQSTVREALMRLQEDGLVVRSGYRGTTVATTTVDEAREMLFLRTRLERQGVQRIAGKADDSLLDSLSGQIRRMETAAANEDEYALTELDRDFHLTIFRCADLPTLEPILSRCMLHIHRITFAERGRTRSLLTSAKRHWDIVDALRTRDPATAAKAVDHHVGTVLQTGLQSVRFSGADSGEDGSR